MQEREAISISIIVRNYTENFICCEDCEEPVLREDTSFGVCFDCLCGRLISRCGDDRVKSFLIDNRSEFARHLRDSERG